MSNPTPSQKIKSIYTMLFELATGNLAFRIIAGTKDDGIDHLIRLLHQFADRMRITLQHHEFVIPHYTYQNLIQLTIITDQNFIIINCNQNVGEMIGYAPKDIIGTDILPIIAKQSWPLWKSIAKKAAKQSQFRETVQLIFVTPKAHLVPSYCTIFRLANSDHTIISTVTTILQDMVYDLPNKPMGKTKSTSNDAETMQQLHDYIMQHLDEPLPTLKQLAKMYRTNEFELKQGFRNFYNTSIHHFYNEERLKRAHLMIVQTDAPLKEIAFANGFADYNNFYKAFKKRFGYAPKELHRNSL